ncbi:uncharacterized protein FA14DRAFT_158388 [Meira miltonrushii]|uniref:Uncharacterized protein n=1 Tax=Meira miltonrushii TaxID=1280837 RepID=A0A316V1Z3_9BASI|nr:uncharacterized protein FA14DRAFT_158388 [Meira miltonrushii]PWN31569.1 hypothetical protein FA14DRAFT_158388 [Meira miltonrushii]
MYTLNTFAIPVNKYTQVGKIKAAESGMRSCDLKARACNVGSVVASMVGMTKKSNQLAAKSEGHIQALHGHAKDLRAAVEQKAPHHQFGGATTAKQQKSIVNHGQKTLKGYESRVANAKAASAKQNSASFGRMNSFDEMHGGI